MALNFKSNAGTLCSEFFQSALECLDLRWSECESEADRIGINAHANECAAFIDIERLLIDEDTGEFSNTETLNAVVDAIQNIAIHVFGDRFPIQRFKAIDLAVQLAEAGSSICLYDVSGDDATIH